MITDYVVFTKNTVTSNIFDLAVIKGCTSSSQAARRYVDNPDMHDEEVCEEDEIFVTQIESFKMFRVKVEKISLEEM